MTKFRKGDSVMVCVGDNKGNSYTVKSLSKDKTHVFLKSLSYLNSKRKSYDWKVHESNLKKI